MRGQNMLRSLFDLTQATLEQPKNARKGPWEGLSTGSLVRMTCGEIWELLVEIGKYLLWPKRGRLGILHEIPDVVATLGMLLERFQLELIREGREG